MRNYEKILIGLTVIVLLLRAVPSIDPAAKLSLTGLTLMLLSVSYLLGGYWLFRKRDQRFKTLSIIAGIAFCLSLFVLIYILGLHLEDDYKYFLLPNQILCISLGGFLLFKRKQEIGKGAIRGIFIRSGVIAIFTSFLYYTPPSFSVARDVMTFLNNGDERLLDNLKMVEYSEEFKKAYYVDGDCDRAVLFAETANKYGKLWIGIDTNPHAIQKDSVIPFAGTYNELYQAYNSKGEIEFNSNNFPIAITYYSKASRVAYYAAFTGTVYDSNSYIDCKCFAEERMAVCYSNLKEYNVADSLFDKAIHEYRSLPNKQDTVLAQWFSDFALSAMHQDQYAYSCQLIRISLSILNKDSIKNKVAIMDNYYYLAQNYIATDSIQNAMGLLKIVLKAIPESDKFYCAANLYYGTCLYKLDKFHEADTLMNKAIACFKMLDYSGLGIGAAYYALTFVKLALGDFKNANNDIRIAIKTASKISIGGEINPKYLLVLAFIDRQIAEYKESEDNYKMIVNNNYTEKGVLSAAQVGLSHLYTITGKFDIAKSLSNFALSRFVVDIAGDELSSIEYINELAYVRYCLGDYKCADTLYQHVIKICIKNERQNSSHMAIALNGLGLVKTAQKNYKMADSLFTQSMGLHLKIFGQNNPYTALMYLNFGTLRTLEGDYKDAHKMLSDAFTIDASFFEKSHDIFADIYVEMGNLSLKEKNRKDAQTDYEAALTIYTNKFGKDNYKALLTQKLLKNL